LDSLSILYISLSVSVLGFVIVLSVVLLGIRKSVDQITRRLDETLRQVEMTAEDLRKTNASTREVISGLDRAVSNVTHFTEGIRALRGPVDVAIKVLDQSVSPALIGFAGGLAGIRAAASHLLQRYAGKGETR